MPTNAPTALATKRLAPWPSADRTPMVAGATSIARVSSTLRQATTGRRQAYVDMLDEQLEREAHGSAVLSQRNLTVATARLEVQPVETEPGSIEEGVALDMVKLVEQQIAAIDDLPMHLSSLLWGTYYGISALENIWRREGSEYVLDGFRFIHSRRLSFTDYSSWDLYLYDPNVVLQQQASTRNGLRIDDYPGKFTVHIPRLRGDYPTREGLGRVLAYWFAFKAMGVATAASVVERYAKPWAIGYYATSNTGTPRNATDDEVAAGTQTLQTMGSGSLSSAMLPDSIKISLEQAIGGMTQKEWLVYCDQQIGEAVLGQNQTTQLGAHGSRAAISVMKEGTRELLDFDAKSLAATLRRNVAKSIVLLNYPQHVALTPRIVVHVDRPDPDAIMARAVQAASIGMPLDADLLGTQVALPLVKPDDMNARSLGPMLQTQEEQQIQHEQQMANPPPTNPNDHSGGQDNQATGE